MLTEDQRNQIFQKVYAKAATSNNTLPRKYHRDVLIAIAYNRTNAVLSTLQRALNNAYGEIADSQLLDAKHKLVASKSGNRESRRKAKVTANRQARAEAASEKKRLRIEARKKTALIKKAAKNEEEND